jgi:putative nucleotidyltransferase with HDIG domain
MSEQPRSKALERLARPSGVLGVLAAGVAVGLMLGLDVPKESTVTLLAFVLFVAVGESLEVTLPWGSLVTMGLAPAVGFMLRLDCSQAAALNPAIANPAQAAARYCGANGNGPAEVVAVFLAGALIALGMRKLRGKDLRLQGFFLQTLTVSLASLVYTGLAKVDHLDAFGPANISYFGIAGVFIVTIAADALIPSVATSISEKLPLLPLLSGRLRSSAALQIASVSVGALLALAHPTLGTWAFPLFLVPLIATQYSFRQFASIRKTYLQTIRALAKVPEMAGYTEPGHSARVAEIAVDIAQEMGIEQAKIEEIQYAALLHDIGRVSLPDPESANDSTYRLELALVGAAIVEQTGYLPEVANIIRQQHEPYRRRGEDQNRELELGAKIIKVASAYDDFTYPPGPGKTPWEALEKLHFNMAYEFDPQVIQALTRVLEKRSEI